VSLEVRHGLGLGGGFTCSVRMAASSASTTAAVAAPHSESVSRCAAEQMSPCPSSHAPPRLLPAGTALSKRTPTCAHAPGASERSQTGQSISRGCGRGESEQLARPFRRAPPVPLTRAVGRAEGYTYAANVWDSPWDEPARR
jgi:hypothetical protein